MSTKIHHGYRLAAGSDPFDFIAAARTVLDDVRDRADLAAVAAHAADLIDRADLKGEPRPDAPLRQALLATIESRRTQDPNLRGSDPTGFALSLGRDDVTGRVGALIFTEHPDLTAAFEALPGVEKYGYWNNSDAPDNVTEQEWVQRAAFWDRILPGYTPPVEAMLGWTLRGQYDGRLPAMLAEPIDDTVTSRLAETIAGPTERATRHAFEAMLNAASAAGESVADVVFDYARTAKYPEVVAAIADHLADLTPGDLHAPEARQADPEGLAALATVAEKARARIRSRAAAEQASW